MLEADNDEQRDKILSTKDLLSAINEEEINSFFRNKNKNKAKKEAKYNQITDIPTPTITKSTSKISNIKIIHKEDSNK